MIGRVEEDERQFFRYQAERCRRLARQSTDPEVALKLGKMARDYDTKAAAVGSGSAPHQCDHPAHREVGWRRQHTEQDGEV
jgi:hypothetical protein